MASSETVDEVMAENGGISNGSASTPGVEKLGRKGWIDRVEFIRLMEQALYSLGYRDVAGQLESASGIPHEEQHVVSFREAVHQGSWEKALELLERLGIDGEDKLKQAKFLVLEQKFLEAVERKQWKVALQHLRTELAPLEVNLMRLHELASCLICQDLDDLKETARWDGIGGFSRGKVLLALQDIMPPEVMLPDNRMLGLLEQAIESQLNKCVYHNSKNAVPSLLSDYTVGEEQIPSQQLHELCAHSDEVWHLQFSHDGRRLASCSKDGVTIIWVIHSRERVEKQYELRGHSEAVVYLSWSPDDRYLATASQDKTIRVWNTATGKVHTKIEEHKDFCSSVGWLPDSKRLISGANDSLMYMWSVEGKKLRTWDSCRVQDLAISKTGERLVTLGSDKKIRLYDLEGDGSEFGMIEYEINISAISLSDDGSMLLVSTQKHQIDLWELNNSIGPQPSGPSIVYKTDDANTQQKYIIRTCFGGIDEAFVLSGSEECKVYVWHRRTGELLTELEGHSGTVNSVSWNPVDPYMFASASDDRTIHIWGVSDIVAKEAGIW